MKQAFTSIAVAAALAAFWATAAAQDAPNTGMEVFVAQKCTTCHSIAGRGNKKGALDDVGARLSAAEIEAWLRDPDGMAAKRTPPSTRKPPMKKKAMPDGDIGALVAFLSAQKG